MFNKTEINDHEYVIRLFDKKSGLIAFVAIHSTALGLPHGGTRFYDYSSEEAALDDALRLSRAMSLKSALANLPYGGGKGVIIDTGGNKKDILNAYAQKIEKLNGAFHTGTDVGLSDKDAINMAQHSKYILGLPKARHTNLTTSSAAAHGVYISMNTAVKEILGKNSLSGLKIGIKGVGKLGAGLLERVLSDNAEVVIADTNSSAIDRIKTQFPSVKIVEPSEIHKQKVDVYAPCALGQEFDKQNIDDLRCKIIVGGANNQLDKIETGDLIHQKNIVYVPDFVANAGGLIFVCEDLESDGFNEDRVMKRLNDIQDTVAAIIKESLKKHLPTARIAESLGSERINLSVSK